MANAILNVGQTGGQINISTAAAPATPAVGVVTLYAGTDKALHALNSDGTDITIAAAGAASPITVQQTNSLVSTAVGATATSTTTGAVIIGATACSTSLDTVVIGRCASATVSYACGNVVIGSLACSTAAGGANSGAVVVGYKACETGVTDGPGNVTIGCNARSVNSAGNVAIGPNVCVTGTTNYILDRAQVAIGNSSESRCNGAVAVGVKATACGGYSLSLGVYTCTFGAFSIGIGTSNCSCSDNSITLGTSTVVGLGSACSTAIGNSSNIFPGATGTIVLGNSSVGGTAACNSVVIGNSAQTTAACSVVIGQTACGTEANTISIGLQSAACSEGTIAIGKCSRVCANPYEHGAIAIGTCAQHNGIYGVVLGFRSCTTGGNQNTVIGDTSCAGNTSQAFGSSVRATGSTAIAIGYDTTASGNGSIAIGGSMCSTAACAVAIGLGAISSHACAVALGANITTEKTNTTHVNSLIAYGQAASKAHAVGSTGGTATLNWDNSNVQFVTLTSSVTSLTKSNPIDGAVYTVFVTQGGSGGYTVNWGTDVRWAGGTGPTLSTAIGATDAVSLVYYAGITGYYGNANLNFA